jgi:hypothetical protein
LKILVCYCSSITYISKEFINLKELYCRGVSITEIPEELVNLQKINCSECVDLINIPNTLVNLTYLDCNDCLNITEIPKELINLKIINCRHCYKMKEIPKELINLKYLDMSYNDMTYCNDFKYLKRLHCTGCPYLTFIPIHFEDENENIKTNYLNYRKDGCKKLVSIILEELIQRTWEPKRAMDWCWDEEEKKFMNEMIS